MLSDYRFTSLEEGYLYYLPSSKQRTQKCRLLVTTHSSCISLSTTSRWSTLERKNVFLNMFLLVVSLCCVSQRHCTDWWPLPAPPTTRRAVHRADRGRCPDNLVLPFGAILILNSDFHVINVWFVLRVYNFDLIWGRARGCRPSSCLLYYVR